MAKLRASTSSTETQPPCGAARRIRCMPIGPRTVLGDYVITRPIGRGGFGTIWRAAHRHTAGDVAIKVLHPELALSPPMVSRFEREARVIAMIQHPNVVALHELGKLADGRPYLVMEFLPGTSLSKVIKQRGPLPPEDVMNILDPLASALAAAHAHGVIHRDVKASNVMICDADGARRVVLLDFGVAKLLEDRGPQLTAPLAAVGSPHCMAPEQIRGEAVDARTDVYGLGALAFYMLTGEQPFPGNRGEAMSRHLLEERPRPSDRLDITSAFDEVVMRAMARAPAERFASPLELAAAFRAVACDQGEQADVVGCAERAVRAVGVYIDVRIDLGGHDDDESIYDAAESVLPLCEAYLGRRGYLFVHEIGNSGLFILPVSEGAGDARAWLRQVVEDSAYLARLIEQRDNAHPRVCTDIHIHIGDAGVHGGVVEGGSLLEPSTWMPMQPWDEGVWISLDAAGEIGMPPPVQRSRR